MGAAASTEAGDNRSEDCKKFCECFLACAQKGRENLAARRQSWMAVDYNGNGYVSLAECDAWVMKTVKGEYGEDTGDALWKRFRPSLIRAYNDAKDASPERPRRGAEGSTTDDYVTKREFRLLNAYLCIYGSIYDAFTRIDGGGEGVGAEDDRRLSAEEWGNTYNELSGYGFVGLNKIADEGTEDSVESVFDEIANFGGTTDARQITLMNFSNWVAKQEEDAGTEMGRLLGVGDDD